MAYENAIIFNNLTTEQRKLIEPLFTYRQESAGTTLFDQGDEAKNLYIVVEGEVEIRYKPDDGPPLVVTRVRPENVVGWSAALGNPLYTSSAVCTVVTTVFSISGSELRQLCENHPEICPIILDRLATMIAKRLRNTHSHIISLLRQGLGIKNSIPVPVEPVSR